MGIFRDIILKDWLESMGIEPSDEVVEKKSNTNVQYQYDDGWHIFTSPDVPELYVADRDPEKAYSAVTPAIEDIQFKKLGRLIRMVPGESFEEFEARMHESH